MKDITNWDQLPLVLAPKDVKHVMGIGTNRAYDLFHRHDFPAVKVGNGLRVGRDAFRNWLERQVQAG